MKKQVVFIMVDTQSADMLGCYGNEHLKTPNLDNLASEGVVYDKAYTCQPVCGPARSAIFTGLYPHSNGAWTNSVALSDNVKTIGQRLRDNGFKTAYVGKWHLDGGDYFGTGKCPDGWDERYWYDMKRYLDELTPEERVKSRRSSLMKTEGVSEEFTYGHRCSNRAISYIENNKDDDFLLVLSYDEPHGPYLCPQPYASMYDDYVEEKRANVFDTLESKPIHQQVWAGARRFMDRNAVDSTDRLLYSCNSFVDYEIGRVTEKIKELIPDALIIYTSDHGDMRNSHCLASKGPAPYDEITRIPFIVSGKNVRKNCRYSYPISHIDIVPTIMEYMGLEKPQWSEGNSILKTFTQPEEKVNDAIFIEFGRYEIDHDGFGGFQPMRCVFDGRYKLCVNLLSTDELYDLQEDPYENQNLIECEKLSEIRNALHDRLLEWMNQTRDPFRGYYWRQRPWRNDDFKPTWKYTGYTRQRENEEYEPRQLDYDTGIEMEEATRIKN